MTTAALTLADFAGRFNAIQGFVTNEILALINGVAGVEDGATANYIFDGDPTWQ